MDKIIFFSINPFIFTLEYYNTLNKTMMMSILNKFKSLTAGIMVLSFFVAVTFSSCSGNKKAEQAETATESSEHPEGGDEHPSGGEHPTGGEHPSDTTKSEHPESKEHPK